MTTELLSFKTINIEAAQLCNDLHLRHKNSRTGCMARDFPVTVCGEKPVSAGMLGQCPLFAASLSFQAPHPHVLSDG